MSQFSVIISVLALLVAAVAANYSREQTEIARQSYDAAVNQLDLAKKVHGVAEAGHKVSIDQLNLAKKAQDVAEANYDIAEKQLELQRKTIAADYDIAEKQLELQRKALAADNQFKVVLSSDTDENLSKSLTNGQDIELSLFNSSKNPVSYRVAVQSVGVGVYWHKMTPPNLVFAISLDKRPIVIQPNAYYERSFSIWVGQTPASTAKITILVNDAPIVEYNYVWNAALKRYDYRGN